MLKYRNDKMQHIFVGYVVSTNIRDFTAEKNVEILIEVNSCSWGEKMALQNKTQRDLI